jgi:hypothetical protein
MWSMRTAFPAGTVPGSSSSSGSSLATPTTRSSDQELKNQRQLQHMAHMQQAAHLQQWLLSLPASHAQRLIGSAADGLRPGWAQPPMTPPYVPHHPP